MQPTPSPYARSIFAHTLAAIVASHGLELDDLARVPVKLPSKTIIRLAASLANNSDMPGLNQGEINTIVFGLRLSDTERLGIYAGLIALGAQRQMLQYLSDQRAWDIAEEVRAHAHVWLVQQHRLGRDPFRRVRHGSGGEAGEGVEVSHGPLGPALGAFDEGTRLSALGEFSANGEVGRGFLEEALFHFTRSARLLDEMAPSLRATDDWLSWREEVRRAGDHMRDLLE